VRRAIASWGRHSRIVILAAGLARATLAHGDGKPGIELGGDATLVVGASSDERAVVGAAVVAAARAAGWAVPPEPLAVADSDRPLDCGDPSSPLTCVPPSIARRGLRRLFAFAVERRQADNGASMVVLTARLIVTAPPALVVGQRYCEHCADDRLARAAGDLARQLLRELAVRTGRTVLDVASTPAGAQISVDGHPIGATDATFDTFPGAHRVVVERAGYRSEARTVIAEEGKTAAVVVTLVPSSTAARPTRSARLAYGALGVGGGLAVVAGGLLLDLGTRGGRDDRYIYAGAMPAGAAIGLAGVAAIAAGVYGWWRSSVSSAPTVALTNGGVVAGWLAAF